MPKATKKTIILITGSSGYIGSCCYKYFEVKKKYNVIGVDKKEPYFNDQKNFIKKNISNYNNLKKIVKFVKPTVIIHLAGQSTIDGIKNKLNYKINNESVTKNVVKVCNEFKISKLLFSSTAAVYRSSKNKITESSSIDLKHIYSKTKMNCENLIRKKLNKDTNYIIFRFFNVCSSLFSLRVGELHNPETHLVPILVSKILNNRQVHIYGNDYKTKDGTCVRDYLHILDLLNAFKMSLHYLDKKKSGIFNLGASNGSTVLEMYNYTKKKLLKNEKLIKFAKRRYGDVPFLFCSNSKIQKSMKWKPKNSSIQKIINDEIKWQKYLKIKGIIKKNIY
jgi:UDP-glucose 4-epimerase